MKETKTQHTQHQVLYVTGQEKIAEKFIYINKKREKCERFEQSLEAIDSSIEAEISQEGEREERKETKER
jgi:hypothetical protein